jgi:hypothetical protein
MLDIKRNGIYATTSIIDIYNIIDLYSHTFTDSLLGHDNCLCKQQFNKSKKILMKKELELEDYLMNHYQKMYIVPTIVNKFCSKYSNVNWLVDHYIHFGGKNNNFKYTHKLDLIGQNNNYVFIGYIKPQYNELNINDILINSIIDTFIIQNIKQKQKKDGKIIDTENYKRYNNKKIITCVFTLDRHEPVFIDWYKRSQTNIITTPENNKIVDMFESDNSDSEVDLTLGKEDTETADTKIEYIDLIKENDTLIRNLLKDYIYNKFSVDNKNFHLFFKHYRDQKLDPKKFIKIILDEYDKIYYKNINSDTDIDTIKYFKTFLDNLKSEINKNNNESYRKYKNQNDFMEELNNLLKSDIMEYLNLEDNDNDNIINNYVSDDEDFD